MTIYKIPQDEIKKFLKLDGKKFHEIKKQIGINTIEPLNEKNLTTIISFLNKTGETAPTINEIDLKKYVANEYDICIKDIPEPRKIKIYKQKKTKVHKVTVKINDEKEDLEKVVKVHGKKRIFTAAEDKKILDFYNSVYYKNPQNKNLKNSYSMQDLCKDLKASDRKMIAIRASELGFTNFILPAANKEFSKEEIELLSSCIGKYQTSKIQKIFKQNGYQRSIVSLNVQMQRHKLSRKLDGKGDMSLRLISEAFGVDHHFFSDSVARLNSLNPTRTKKEMIFTRKNIKKYIIENPYDFNLGKVDNKFFIELLTEEFE